MSTKSKIIIGALKAIDLLLWVATLGPLWLLKDYLDRENTGSEAVPGSESKNCTVARRRAGGASKGLVDQPAFGPKGENTVHTLFQNSVRKFSDSPALKTRTFLGWVKVEGERFPLKNFGETVAITYSEMETMVSAGGAGLRELGLKPQAEKNVAKNDFSHVTGDNSIVIYEETCAPWMIIAQAAWSQSMVITTIYGTLGPDAVAQAVNEGGNTTLFCNRKNVDKVAQICDKMPTLKNIIYSNELVTPEEMNKPFNLPKGINVTSFEDLIENGKRQLSKYPSFPPSPDMLAVIMYTSGTTGKPKGVMLKHRSLIGMAAGIGEIIMKIDVPQLSYVGYLPLAHIFELVAEVCILGLGGSVGYADPRTLTAVGCRPHGALKEFSPRVFIAVPKILEIIMKGAIAKINKQSGLKRDLAEAAFAWKQEQMLRGLYTPLFDLLVFRKLKQALGGSVEFVVSGGGPLAANVQQWLKAAFTKNVLQGYGLTETAAGGCLEDFNDMRGGIVGPPKSCCELKLRSCIDAQGEPEVLDKQGKPYLCSDTVDSKGNKILGRGEVLIRGSNVATGYFKMADKTKEVFLEDGWFCTGDVGVFLDDGALQIVDRIKNLVKLKGGEYIAMENMELVYSASPFVDAMAGGMMVYGDGSMDRPVALVQVNKPALMEWAEERGLKGTYEELARTKEASAAVLESMDKLWKSGGLTGIEKLAGVSLVRDPWTPENKCLTATNKLSRHGVADRDDALLQAAMKLGRR